MTKEMPSFVTKYCRMCAVELKAGVFIFGEEGKRLHLPEKIRKTLAILVLEEDSLPKKICTDCCSSLEDYSQYKETVLDAQEKLASIAKNLESNNNCHSENENKSGASYESDKTQKSPKRAENETQTALPEENLDDEKPSSSKSSRSENLSINSPTAVRCGFCPSANEIFDDRQKFTAHIIKCHGDLRNKMPRYRCPHCPKVTERYNMLRNHIQRHMLDHRIYSESGSSRVPCITNSVGGDTQRLSKNEAHCYESKSYPCKECGKRFLSRKAMDEHAASRHSLAKGTMLEIESCQEFSDDASLPDYGEDDEVPTEASAVNMHSSENNNRFRCIAAEEEKMESHSQKSTKVVFLNREGDSTAGAGRKGYIREAPSDPSHEESSSEKSGNHDGKIWKCNVCSKVLTSNTGYHNHMMVHKGRRFDCEQCGVSYLQKATLLHHMKVHHVVVPKKYKCSACNKEFHELKFLTQHAKMHSTPSQEFQCNICQKVYKTGRCLRRHVKLHSSNKKYVCNLCGKAFRVKSKLDEHENSHTGKRPLGCNFCDKAFNGHPNYVKHIRRKHPNEISRENKIPPPKKAESKTSEHTQSQSEVPATPPPPPPPPLPVSQAPCALAPAPAHSCDFQFQNQQSVPQSSSYSSSVSGKNFVNPSGGGANNGPNGSGCSGQNASVNALDLMDCAIQSALVGESSNGTSNSYEHAAGQSQNEPMELSYKLESNGFQDMPMELTKVFQRDPLELCVRQDLNQLMDLSSRVDTSGIVSMSMNMAGVNVHKLDLTERELMDLSGAFRQPIDLISRTDDTPHDLYNEGSLVDLSLRSTFGQDQSASSFLRELIDLSARSDSFHGELDLTKPHHSHGNAHQPSHVSANTSGIPHTAAPTNTANNISPKSGTSSNVATSLQNVVYQDAMFSLQN